MSHQNGELKTLRVFISWSKNSRGVGKALSDAVAEIFDPMVKTFISQEILAGSRGLDIIDTQLNETDFGIICLTKANQSEQWINYEAGALSRQVADKRTRMGVFLIDLPGPEEVNSPLDIFQCKLATFEGFTDLMVSLNELGPNPTLQEANLTKRIDSAWPAVKKAVEVVQNGKPDVNVKPPKSQAEKVDEMLGLVKAMEASFGDVLTISRQSLDNTEVLTHLLDRREGRLDPVKYWHPSMGRAMDGSELPPPREIDDLLNDSLQEITSAPFMEGVKVSLSNHRIQFKLKRPIAPSDKKMVMAKLDPFYAPRDIGFTVDESREKELDGMELI